MFRINKRKFSYIIIGALLLSLLYITSSESGIDLIRKNVEYKTLTESADSTETPIENKDSSTIMIIPHTLFEKWYNQKAFVIIDARDQWDYAEGHIKGAVNIPEYSFEPDSLAKFDISLRDTIVIYCSASDCDISKRLANQLKILEFKNLFVYEDGYENWLNNDLPIERSDNE